MDFKNTLTLLNAPVATQEYVRSRGTNLVTNGFGLLGTNYNFSGSVYDPVNLYAGKGSFKYAGDSLVKMTDELIPVDPARSYQLSVWGKATTYVAGAHTYVGIACHDMDGLVIVSQHHMRWAGTDTTLAVALNPGDTTITLTSATNWQGANATAYIRQIVIWNYVSGTGYAYPAYSYSRNVSYNYATYVTNGAWAVGGITGNVIALTAPWPGAAVPAGTAVSNMNSGGVYKYIAEANVVVPTTWTNYAGVIGTLDSSGTNDNTKFSPGTALVKLLFLFNRDVPGNVTNLSAVTFSENAPLTHTHAGVYQPVDADLTAIAALAGTLGLLKKTAADTWALDTSTYLTSAVTSVTGTAPIAVATGTTTPAISISAASGAAAGSMSAADFTKLADVATGATANVGTVTSVGLSLPSILTVTVSPVTTAGTLTATLTSQTAGTVLASPTTGADAAPTFRALEATDIPSLAASKITSGAVALARGGTGADLSATGAGFLKQASAGATVTVAAVTKSDVGLGSVENTALSTWAGSTNLTTLGTVETGSWHGTTIALDHGGTGVAAASANAAFNALSPLTTSGDMLYRNATVNAALTGATAYSVLSMTSAVPSWVRVGQATGYILDKAAGDALYAPASSLSTHVALTTTAHGGIVADTDSRLTNARTPTAHSHDDATTLTAGFFSAAEKIKLTGIAPNATANVGTVTSVGLSLPSILTVTVSPVTSSGTLTATLTSQTAGTVLAAPAGSAGTPTFRALEATDIPTLAYAATSHTHAGVYQPVGSYLTANQTITASGDATGSGTTALALTLATVATPGTYRSVTVDAKGRVTAGTTPTTLSGYAISDAAPLTHTTNTSNPHSVTAAQVGAPTTTGTGASGTWPISVTGRATYLNTTSVSDMNSIVPAGVYQAFSPANQPTPAHWHWLQMPYLETSEGWAAQIAVSFYADALWFRRQSAATWQPWREVLHSSNYSSYAPTLTGTGASGTWPISVTGNSATTSQTSWAALTTTSRLTATGSQATSIATATGSLGGVEIQGPGGSTAAFMCFHRPGIYAAYFGLDTDNVWKVGGWTAGAVAYPILHSGNYSSYALPLTGGTLTGDLTIYNAAYPTTGVIGFGNSGSRYLYYDGANYQLAGTQLDVNGSRVLHAANYSSYALPLTGGATTGPVGIRVGAWTGAGLQVRGPGTTASTYGLVVTNSAGTNGFWINDAGTAYVRNSPVTFSDARLKAAIEPLTGALAIVCAIPARSWRWKDDLNGPTRYGPIAQETELVAPELVVEGSPGPGEKLIPGERPLLSLRGDSLLGLVHGAIHELAARVAALETA